MAFARNLFITVWHFISRHSYLVTIAIFVLVVGFLDPNSFYHRFLHQEEIQRLKDQIQENTDRYNEDTKSYLELEANPRAVEKIARERYYMKRPNEDVYICK